MEPGAPWNYTIDVLGELEDLQNKNYTRDYDFQTDVQAVFRKLHDAHTFYMKPSCYQTATALQPVAIFPRVTSDGTVVLYATGLTFRGENLAASIDSRFLGKWHGGCSAFLPCSSAGHCASQVLSS